tara:strand:- start:7072 stop:7293 length:222 start_codon:yes stop_codon:yes gene_type:complete
MTLGDRIKEARERKTVIRSMSQRELAILAGVSPVTISRLETNIQIGVKSDKIIPLADALGVTIDYLLGSEEGE